MAPYGALRIVSWTLLVLGVLFYITSVAGMFWPKASSPTDVGVYSVTVVLVGFGLGGLMLRSAKLRTEQEA